MNIKFEYERKQWNEIFSIKARASFLSRDRSYWCTEHNESLPNELTLPPINDPSLFNISSKGIGILFIHHLRVVECEIKAVKDENWNKKYDINKWIEDHIILPIHHNFYPWFYTLFLITSGYGGFIFVLGMLAGKLNLIPILALLPMILTGYLPCYLLLTVGMICLFLTSMPKLVVDVYSMALDVSSYITKSFMDNQHPLVKIFVNIPTSVTTVKLDNNNLNKLTCNQLVELISAIPSSVSRIDLSHNHIFEEKTKEEKNAVLTALKPFLKRLVLDDNGDATFEKSLIKSGQARILSLIGIHKKLNLPNEIQQHIFSF